MLFSVYEITFVAFSVCPRVDTATFEFAVCKLAFVSVSVWPSIHTGSLELFIDEISFISLSFRECHYTFALYFSVLKLSFVYNPAEVGKCAPTGFTIFENSFECTVREADTLSRCFAVISHGILLL